MQKLLLALVMSAGVFPIAEVAPTLSRTAQAAPMPRTATLYVAQTIDINKPRNGLTAYKWYYINVPNERHALNHDIAMFKAKGWATYVHYD